MPEYVLEISEGEIARYRMMAEHAISDEADLLAKAGITEGATVADIGCGPAAISVALARLVGESGRVIGVERDGPSRQAAAQVVAAAGVDNVEIREGEAAATGLEPGSVDAVVMRHVLAHNGGSEAAIVEHLAQLVRPGGSVYLVDVDLRAMRVLDNDPDVDELVARYPDFHATLGNDPLIGLRLASLLRGAGLVVSEFVGRYNIVAPPPGVRPPPWTAREQMLAAGLIDQGLVDRCEAAFERLDARAERPTLFAPNFIAIGRREA
ncbi:MAG: methyltransferase domain-containing protein [Frankiaceae bacterium]|nr:methyltransferase domain-containing protein [Frankiaceae bacterium]